MTLAFCRQEYPRSCCCLRLLVHVGREMSFSASKLILIMCLCSMCVRFILDLIAAGLTDRPRAEERSRGNRCRWDVMNAVILSTAEAFWVRPARSGCLLSHFVGWWSWIKKKIHTVCSAFNIQSVLKVLSISITKWTKILHEHLKYRITALLYTFRLYYYVDKQKIFWIAGLTCHHLFQLFMLSSLIFKL